jgi:light-regulated signal transduction histidine kinase (bacteriophytochrome)
MDTQPQPAITLANCANEPIHIPGSIQPHGALLVFDATLNLTGWSANTGSLLGLDPTLGAPARSLALQPDVIAGLDDILSMIDDGEATPLALEILIQEVIFDVVIHAHLNRIIVEFEHRELPSDEVASFALKAHRAIDRLKRQKSVESLLQIAVEEVQKLTGFDRVMAYIFRHDDSGDVVAEQRRPDLDAYLGRRYPASDIPAQARRLYTLNSLRLIADVAYEPIPLIGSTTDAPLDMSHCVLRSVSPIHIEYLRNMGVGASMSVSLIVKGRLWGMLACHHMSALQIPYSIRMACDVMAQIIAATVVSLQEQKRAELTQQASSVRAALMETLLNEDDVLRALAIHGEALKSTLDADALAIAQHGKTLVFGDIPIELAREIQAALPTEGDDLVLWQTRKEWPQHLQEKITKWVGLLAMRFDPVTSGWILAFRLEQIETVNWGGKPEKEIQAGPLGPRLTPRGSFDEWKEIVRDSAEPWEIIRLESARELLSALLRTSNLRHAETDRARTQLMAILGHDLRDPLNSINLAAHFLKDGSNDKMGTIIRNSSSRMQRLISQVLDMSRLGTGLGLGIEPEMTDVIPVINDLINEARLAYPGVDYETSMPNSLLWRVDSDRLAQAIGNLLGNARRHGSATAAVTLSLSLRDNNLIINVSNEAEEIDPLIVANLFSPFKKSSATHGRTGLGLGLYITKEIISGHGGELNYHYKSPKVIFSILLPSALAD